MSVGNPLRRIRSRTQTPFSISPAPWIIQRFGLKMSARSNQSSVNALLGFKLSVVPQHWVCGVLRFQDLPSSNTNNQNGRNYVPSASSLFPSFCWFDVLSYPCCLCSLSFNLPLSCGFCLFFLSSFDWVSFFISVGQIFLSFLFVFYPFFLFFSLFYVNSRTFCRFSVFFPFPCPSGWAAVALAHGLGLVGCLGLGPWGWLLGVCLGGDPPSPGLG